MWCMDSISTPLWWIGFILARVELNSCKFDAGYKISALDVENAMMRHPAVREVAVVGIPDEALGQKV